MATGTWKCAQHHSSSGNASQTLNEIAPHNHPNDTLLRRQEINVSDDVEKREFSCTVVGNVTWYGYSRRQHGDSSKSRKRATIKSRSSTSGHLSQERTTLNIYVFMYVCVCVCVCVYVCIPMLISALSTITKIWNWPKHPTWILNCSPQCLGLILWMTEVLERFE